MKTLKLGMLAIFVAGTVVGCSHTHERVIVEKEPANTTTVVK